MVMVLPWVRHRREAEQLKAKLDAERQATKRARERTTAAHVQHVQSDRSTKSFIHQVEKNGWTEALVAAMGRRA